MGSVTRFLGAVLVLAACGGTARSPTTPEPITATVTPDSSAPPVTSASTSTNSVPDSATTMGATLPAVSGAASPLLVGDAHPQLPAGKPGAVSAVAIGPAEPATLDVGASVSNYVVVPFVVWNTTSAPVEGLAMAATATDPTTGKTHDGTLGALTPSHLDPGQWGLAAVQFLSAPSLPDNTAYDVSFTEGDYLMSRATDLQVRDLASGPDGAIRTVTIVNPTSLQLGSPFTVAVYCFDGDRVISTQTILWNAGPDGFTFAPGAQIPFKFSLDSACRSVLVGAVSYHQ